MRIKRNKFSSDIASNYYCTNYNMIKNKVCIVTGAARGIGAAIAKKLGENGAHVAFTYVSDSSADKATDLENEMKSFGVNAKAYKSNAADFAQCETW